MKELTRVGTRKVEPQNITIETIPVLSWMDSFRQVQVFSIVYEYGLKGRWGYMWQINNVGSTIKIFQEDVFGGDLDKIRMLGRVIYEGLASASELVEYANDKNFDKLKEFMPSDMWGFNPACKLGGSKEIYSVRLQSTFDRLNGLGMFTDGK